jgi:hypothetical protein
MRLPEQRLYDWLVRRIGHLAHLTRVENRVKRDTPDLYVAFNQIPGGRWSGWIEMKALADYPIRPKTPIKLGHWTTGQRYWATRHRSCGGQVALLVEIATTGDLYLFRAADVWQHIDQWTRDEWVRHALWHGDRNADSKMVLDNLGCV